MPRADIPGGHIHYEVADPDDGSARNARPLILVEGSWTPLDGWPLEFIDGLTSAGFTVYTMDNRDTGRSTPFGGAEDADGGYGLEDMADDVAAVLAHAGLDSAHVAGRSMGAMIAQVLAIRSPERVRSLGLFYSLPGQDPRYVLHGEDIADQVPPPDTPVEVLIEAALAAHRAYMPDGDRWGESAWYEDETRRYLTAAHERGMPAGGPQRHWAALLRAPDRLEALGHVDVPTAIFHGHEDAEIHPVAASDMAGAMPQAELHLYPGMGHFFPPALIPEFVQVLDRTAAVAERSR